MKAVILAGGMGTRFAEETQVRPKPMVEVGGHPILWHIMKSYFAHGVDDFIICCGYRGYMIKEYFANYFLHMSDVTFDMGKNQMEVHEQHAEPWKVTLVDTGIETQTGGRMLRVADYLDDGEPFCCTNGDGVANVDITASIEFHRSHGRMATVAAARPPGRFGALVMDDEVVTGFAEKPKGDGGFINGGFFVLDPACLNLIDGDATKWEEEPLRLLAERDQLRAFHHDGFWQPMDTLRDRNHLEELWASGNPPWRVR
ncbi:MAG: glucose-1-phosphate cytidylyltransferase [Gemmatimonadetes bacterium]|nr:glucose-1-phosphate cytidylyltransferase [Gemmatimonadota bacterium]